MRQRLISSTPFFVNASNDTTSYMDMVAYNWVDYATQINRPDLVNFFIIKNNNPHLTKENGLLNLEIPVLPAYVNASSSRCLSEYVAAGETQEYKDYVSSKYDAKKLKSIKENFARKTVNYIRHEIGKRYLLAKNYGDTKTMNMLESLSVMKGFDFSKLEYILSKTLPESKYPKNYLDYLKYKDKVLSLKQVISNYQNYDIEAARNPVPGHSVKPSVLVRDKSVKVLKPNGSKLNPNSKNQFGKDEN